MSGGNGRSIPEDAGMPSVAWQNWTVERVAALDEIEHAHRSVGGTGPGRRYLTQHINQAYAVAPW
jgi:hypothetical protein